MSLQFKELAALVEDLSLVPSIPVRQILSMYNASFRESIVLF